MTGSVGGLCHSKQSRAAAEGVARVGISACPQMGPESQVRSNRQFRDNYHIAGRLMTLGWLLGWYCGLPMKIGGLRTVGPSTVRSPAVHAAKPPGIAIHRPGCTCRKAAGDSHPPQAAWCCFISFHLLGPVDWRGWPVSCGGRSQ